MQITKEQARTFLLRKHGLIGKHRFIREDGICGFVNQAGCVQFDPIDVCGKNAEIVFQSRVRDFSKSMLHELLYKERKLMDYFDKNLAIMAVGDWKYFSRTRKAHKADCRNTEQIEAATRELKLLARQKGKISSKDLGKTQKVDWYWSSSSLARAALETLYFRGELMISDKKGALKYYSLTEDVLPPGILDQPDPNLTEIEYKSWHVLRRIGAVGMLWNKASDAWLGVGGWWSGLGTLKASERQDIFASLLAKDLIREVLVEGMKVPLYILSEDSEMLKRIIDGECYEPRTELIAPLDNLLWDRRLIEEVFGFSYKWEIYTPQAERKYGYYVLPILQGKEFVGRIELVADRKGRTLSKRNIWYEAGKQVDESALESCLERFAVFNGCLFGHLPQK